MSGIWHALRVAVEYRASSRVMAIYFGSLAAGALTVGEVWARRVTNPDGSWKDGRE